MTPQPETEYDAPAPPAEGSQPDPLAEPPETEPGPEAGYRICIGVKPTGGLCVYKEPLPETLPPDAIEVDEMDDALRAAVKLFKENPIQVSDQQAFQGGFGEPPESL